MNLFLILFFLVIIQILITEIYHKIISKRLDRKMLSIAVKINELREKAMGIEGPGHNHD